MAGPFCASRVRESFRLACSTQAAYAAPILLTQTRESDRNQKAPGLLEEQREEVMRHVPELAWCGKCSLEWRSATSLAVASDPRANRACRRRLVSVLRLPLASVMIASLPCAKAGLTIALLIVVAVAYLTSEMLTTFVDARVGAAPARTPTDRTAATALPAG